MVLRNRYFGLIVLFILLYSPKSNSQALRMGPPIVELLVTPASSQTFYVSLTNQSNMDMNCEMSVKAMGMTEAGLPYPVDTADRDAQSWITINDEISFLLKVNETRRLRCTVKPPLKTPPGGYYAMILSRLSQPQRVLGSRDKMSTAVRLSYQFASVVMAVVKGANVQAKINPEGAAIFAGDRAASGPDRNWYVKVPIRNDGNIHVVLEGYVEIFSETGQVVKKMGLIAGRGYLLPEQRREFKAEGTGPLPDGVYVANIRLGQTDIDQFATERIPFYVMNGQVYPGTPDAQSTATLDETSQGFILDKNTLNIEAVAGGKKVQVVRLTNITGKPVEIETFVRPWDQDEKGNIIFPDESKHKAELDTNIQINPVEFTLEPKRTQNVKLLFRIPKDAAGEYFDAITFNRKGAKLTELPALLESQSLLTAVKVRRTEQAKLTLVGIETKQVKDTGFMFNISLKNEGNVAVYPDGSISIFDEANNRIGDMLGFGDNTYVLPANERTYEVEWKRLLPRGNYRIELVVQYGSDAEAIRKEHRFKAK
ncbi:hypothetical protein JXB12_07270 [candidate division KSB1 bacterium]|nr:hypothetical protein [candidate division KSB1 bacterium]